MNDDYLTIENMLKVCPPEWAYIEMVEQEKNATVRAYYRNLFFQVIEDHNINLQYVQKLNG